MPDFNIDTQEWFPNQQIDGDPDECVAITVTDILGDKDNINYSPDFTYAMTLRLAGSSPSTAGSDPWSGMLSAVGYGLLPMSDADFTSLVKGELYASNWQNYAADDCKTALSHAQNGARVVDLNFNTVLAEARANFGVSMPMLWFSSFTTPDATGILPPARGPITRHNVRVVGQKTVAGVRYMVIKPWLGKKYGWGGYGLMSQNQFIICTQAAYVFNPAANRFFSLLGIAVTRYPFLADFIPQLMKTVPQMASQNAYHNVRVLCDRAGLTIAEKNLICACIYQESGFKNTALGSNRNAQGVVTSTDYGICQVNDYYHIGNGKDFPSVQYVLDNPANVVQWMISMYKHGMLKQWVSYSSGAYKKWLLPKSAMWKLGITV